MTRRPTSPFAPPPPKKPKAVKRDTTSPRRLYERTCRSCRQTFYPWSSMQPYCSRTCSAAGRVMAPTACEQCGKPVPGSLRQRFCGKRCEGLSRRKPAQPCPVCHKAFVAATPRTLTCSAACGYEYRKTRAPLVVCKGCGSEFRPHLSATRRNGGKYCTAVCYWKYLATQPAFIEVTCPSCGSTFRRTRAAVRRVKVAFCSKRCSNEYISGERHHAYRGGERHRRGPGWEANRRACRERDKVCRSCGKTPEQNRQALSVDHLIPWRIFTDERVANELDNLVGLCRSCHGKKTGRAEQAYMRGDVLDWLDFLRDVQVDPASLDRFGPYLRVEGKAA